VTAAHINPALTVEAQFLGPWTATSAGPVRAEPGAGGRGLAPHLHRLHPLPQGKLRTSGAFAPPPGGDALQRLIAGAVVLADRRRTAGWRCG